MDMASAPVLGQTLRSVASQSRHLLLEMSGVTFLGSHGLLVLTQARKACGTDYPLVLVAPSPAVRLALDVIGLAGLFPRSEELGAALAAYLSGPSDAGHPADAPRPRT